MDNKITFQNPINGCDTIATYTFGKVHLKPAKRSVHYDPDAVGEKEAEQYLEDVQEWCDKHTGKRCGSVDEAIDYLVSIGVEQNAAWQLESACSPSRY